MSLNIDYPTVYILFLLIFMPFLPIFSLFWQDQNRLSTYVTAFLINILKNLIFCTAIYTLKNEIRYNFSPSARFDMVHHPYPFSDPNHGPKSFSFPGFSFYRCTPLQQNKPIFLSKHSKDQIIDKTIRKH